MLFGKYDTSLKDALLDANFIHQPSWGVYYNSYSNAIQVLFRHGLTKQYFFNQYARPLLFLLRHNLELCLKYNLYCNHKAIPTTHDLNELANNLGFYLPNEFLYCINFFNRDADGGCFRYFTDAEGSKYFVQGDVMETYRMVENYLLVQSKPSSKLLLRKMFDNPLTFSKSQEWALTFHLGDCYTIHQLRSSYDTLLEFFLNMVKDKKVHLREIYLPLMFLVRHSLELGLKANIIELQSVVPELERKRIDNEHSLWRLFNIHMRLLNDLDVSSFSTSLKNQYDSFKEKSLELHNLMHHQDYHSRQFRYPFDKHGIPHLLSPIELSNLFELLYFVDPFITFTTLVLEGHGVIELIDF